MSTELYIIISGVVALIIIGVLFWTVFEDLSIIREKLKEVIAAINELTKEDSD